MMICPILSLQRKQIFKDLTAGSKDGFIMCQENKCAWYDPEHRQCSIQSINTNLAIIGDKR